MKGGYRGRIRKKVEIRREGERIEGRRRSLRRRRRRKRRRMRG